MSKRSTGETHPFQALEEEAYHAFREWPVWLVLRERELDTHLDGGKPAIRPSTAAGADQPSAKQRRD
jgi:hypothetical protein